MRVNKLCWYRPQTKFKARVKDGKEGPRARSNRGTELCYFEKVSEDGKHIHDVGPIEMTLEQWHKNLPANWRWWSEFYLRHNELRPKEVLRAIEAGMIEAAFREWKENGAHGGLGLMSSYGLRFRDRYAGEEEFYVPGNSFSVEVFILPKRDTRAPSSSSRAFDKDVRDMEDLHGLIFRELMPLTGSDKYPTDISHLERLMSGCKSRQAVHWKFVKCAFHAALWFWRRRHEYFTKLWREYTSGVGHETDRQELRGAMKDCMKLVPSAKNWWTKLIPDSPLHKVYVATRLHDRPIDVLHFGQSVDLHMSDKAANGKRKYFDEEKELDYANDQYVELAFRKEFPLLVVETHLALTPTVVSL